MNKEKGKKKEEGEILSIYSVRKREKKQKHKL